MNAVHQNVTTPAKTIGEMRILRIPRDFDMNGDETARIGLAQEEMRQDASALLRWPRCGVESPTTNKMIVLEYLHLMTNSRTRKGPTTDLHRVSSQTFVGTSSSAPTIEEKYFRMQVALPESGNEWITGAAVYPLELE